IQPHCARISPEADSSWRRENQLIGRRVPDGPGVICFAQRMPLFDLLRKYFADYGYWTVAVILLLENAGIPLPGETTLLFAAFLVFSEHRLTLWGIIVVGVIACTIGDNLGYWIGHKGGRPLLDRQRRIFRISPQHLQR